MPDLFDSPFGVGADYLLSIFFIYVSIHSKVGNFEYFSKKTINTFINIEIFHLEAQGYLYMMY